MKRAESPTSNDNGILVNKRQIRSWAADPPVTLTAPISPPLGRARLRTTIPPEVTKAGSHRGLVQKGESSKSPVVSKAGAEPSEHPDPSTAAIEAGEAVIKDHLNYFSTKLSSLVKTQTGNNQTQPRLSIEGFVDLYSRNQNSRGRHFVIHQHDHPIAGTHYDLRLQISESSSISFAIMYGLPGNPNSRHLGRNASETRVHNVWVRFVGAMYLFDNRYLFSICVLTSSPRIIS